MDEVNGITIRPWQTPDRPAVQAILRFLSDDGEVTAGDAPVYVAERDGVVVGMVTLCVYTTLTGVKACLDHLVVIPESRGIGIGRALVEYAIERARDADASRVDLTRAPQSRRPMPSTTRSGSSNARHCAFGGSSVPRGSDLACASVPE